MSIEQVSGEDGSPWAADSRYESTIPELRMVCQSDLLLHEETDTGRQISLIARLSKDGYLRNPPVVARLIGSNKYLLLDGANRISALQYLNAPHVLVQVEEYDDPLLSLSHWNHVIRREEARTMLDMVQSVPGILTMGVISREKPKDARSRHLCTIAFSRKREYRFFGGGDLNERARYLRQICKLYYPGMARIDRVNHANLTALKKYHADFGALIIYPDFSKSEIREIAESGNRLPSGLTRFTMPRRALGINIPLSLLLSEIPLAEKQLQLEETICKRMCDKKVRSFEEPVFVFDD